MKASGEFDVKLAALPMQNKALGRLTIDKTFRGDLVASSNGEMMSAGTAVKGSAGYVAIEIVTGTLNGKTGTFILQHNGIMRRGEGKLLVAVVPDSGTGELAGLDGIMTIRIADGKHYYEFEYELGA
jgi:Protein of unknown function (DUF3224)